MMKQIDAKPSEHSSSYELKPMHKGWFAMTLVLAAIGIWANGWSNPATYFLLLIGWGIGLATLLVFPKKWLSKIED